MKSRSRFPADLRKYVREARERKESYETIAREVRTRWPQFPDFSYFSVQMMSGAVKPRDLRPTSERQAVKVSLGGPAWSHPKKGGAA